MLAELLAAPENGSDSRHRPGCSQAPAVCGARAAGGKHRLTGENLSDFTGGETEAQGSIVPKGLTVTGRSQPRARALLLFPSKES